jgi:peptidoglycan/LPS O-acetylase OafA/YrhL
LRPASSQSKMPGDLLYSRAMSGTLQSNRAIQLDGMRAIAMVAICWDHWTPHTWPRIFPFEVFLFFFLVMTGYLITGSLIREREKSEIAGGPWKGKALVSYQLRRGSRILAPYYAALAIGFLVIAPDLWEAPLAYFFHLSNFHMATLTEWPAATNHFWSLSMQQQFYLLWPFLMWFMPWRTLPWCVALVAIVGPFTRYHHDYLIQWWTRPEILTWASLDYFAIGGFLAWVKSRGVSLLSPLLILLYCAGAVGYFVIKTNQVSVHVPVGLRAMQQSFLSFALCGVLACGLHGIGGWPGRLLESKPLQKIGMLSYGVYLFHNLAPMVVGKIFPFLWLETFSGLMWEWVKIGCFAMTTWILTLISWKWIELPMQQAHMKRNKA